MKIVCLIGNSYRHFYIANCIRETGALAGMVVEEREAFLPEPPAYLDPHLKDLFVRHFAGRDSAERSFFEKYRNLPPSCPLLDIQASELNTSKVWDFLDRIKPDAVISYGVHKLSPETLSLCPETKWNIHGGLSPKYRGVITHFWPSYQLEPQMTGVTLHTLTDRLDAGGIIHQTVAPLVRGDGVHELACRTVEQFGKELAQVLRKLGDGTCKPPQPQKTSGKLWVEKDWRPEHLRVIYDSFDNRVVDAYLDGKFTRFQPEIVSQLS